MKNFLSKLVKTASIFILRYGLGLVIIWLGFLKFKNIEANYTHQLISEGYASWILKYLTPYALNHIVAYLQIIIGFLIMLKPISKPISLWGGIGACIMFIVSISLLFTSKIVWQTGYGFPELSKAGQTILKDIILLGSSAWCTSDSL